MSCCAVFDAWSLGIANPTPMLPPESDDVPGTRAIAELTPITLPFMSSSGPPEFPGLIAASVWIALMKLWSLPSPADTGRFRAETMPLVTVASSPSGAPTAMTPSPTTTSLDAPNCSGGTSVASILSTARS
jgi:hypothetical protein